MLRGSARSQATYKPCQYRHLSPRLQLPVSRNAKQTLRGWDRSSKTNNEKTHTQPQPSLSTYSFPTLFFPSSSSSPSTSSSTFRASLILHFVSLFDGCTESTNLHNHTIHIQPKPIQNMKVPQRPHQHMRRSVVRTTIATPSQPKTATHNNTNYCFYTT